MALLDATKINVSLKKIMGKSHTKNTKDPSNEADASYLITMADNVWTESISTDTTTAVSVGIAEEVVAEIEEDVTSGGKSYYLKYPTGHASAGNRIYDIIPDSVHYDYEPILYSNYPTVEIPLTAAEDWVFDSANGTITSEDDLGLTGTARCTVFVYLGKKLSTAGAVGKSTALDEYTLDTTDINTNKGVTLTQTPENDDDVILIVIGGLVQDEGVDFTVTGTALSWNTYPLESLLEIGDKIQVSYSYAG